MEFKFTKFYNVRSYLPYTISDFESVVISVVSNKISGEVYKIWQQLVTPFILIGCPPLNIHQTRADPRGVKGVN